MILFVLSLIMTGLLVNAQAVKTDFSGTWNLNTEKIISAARQGPDTKCDQVIRYY